MTRTLLVLLCLVLVVLVALAMRWGWRSRMRRQSVLPDLPIVPVDLGPATLTMDGLYVGSTFADSWQDRVVHEGLGVRADARATLYDGGVLIDRQGSSPIFLPAETWDGARLAPGLAGKVMGAGGLFVVRWHLGESLIDTGMRGDDKSSYPAWVNAINGRVSA